MGKHFNVFLICRTIDVTKRMSNRSQGSMKSWSNGRTDVGLNKLVNPECIYCDKRYSNMGPIRPHLRLHLGVRPYKCAECEYKHWEKNTMMTNHFVLTHGRKGNIEDIKTDFELEKQLEDKVEEDVLEIRENQRKRNRGDPVSPKKQPPRDIGAVFRGDIENRYVQFGSFNKNRTRGNYEPEQTGDDENNNNEKSEKSSLPLHTSPAPSNPPPPLNIYSQAT